MAKKVKVRLKKGVGKHLRLTMPGFSLTIGDGEQELTDEQFKRVQQYVEIVKEKTKDDAPKFTSEAKSLGDSKE